MSDIVAKLWGFCHTLKHDGIECGEDRAGSTESQRQGQDSHRGKCRRSAQHAYREGDVLTQLAAILRPARARLALVGQTTALCRNRVHIAKAAKGLGSRLSCGHTLALEFLSEHVDMEGDIGINLIARGCTPEE